MSLLSLLLALFLLIGIGPEGYWLLMDKPTLTGLPDETTLKEADDIVASIHGLEIPSEVSRYSSEDQLTSWSDSLSYTHSKFPVYERLHGFSLNYPASWTLTEARREESAWLTLTVAKDSAYLRIVQQEAGGGDCLYPGDNATLPSMAERYSSYRSLTNASGLDWRLAQLLEDRDVTRYIVCEKQANNEAYNPISSIGWIELALPSNNASLTNEAVGILESVRLAESE